MDIYQRVSVFLWLLVSAASLTFHTTSGQNVSSSPFCSSLSKSQVSRESGDQGQGSHMFKLAWCIYFSVSSSESALHQFCLRNGSLSEHQWPIDQLFNGLVDQVESAVEVPASHLPHMSATNESMLDDVKSIVITFSRGGLYSQTILLAHHKVTFRVASGKLVNQIKSFLTPKDQSNSRKRKRRINPHSNNELTRDDTEQKQQATSIDLFNGGNAIRSITYDHHNKQLYVLLSLTTNLERTIAIFEFESRKWFYANVRQKRSQPTPPPDKHDYNMADLESRADHKTDDDNSHRRRREAASPLASLGKLNLAKIESIIYVDRRIYLAIDDQHYPAMVVDGLNGKTIWLTSVSYTIGQFFNCYGDSPLLSIKDKDYVSVDAGGDDTGGWIDPTVDAMQHTQPNIERRKVFDQATTGSKLFGPLIIVIIIALFMLGIGIVIVSTRAILQARKQGRSLEDKLTELESSKLTSSSLLSSHSSRSETQTHSRKKRKTQKKKNKQKTSKSRSSSSESASSLSSVLNSLKKSRKRNSSTTPSSGSSHSEFVQSRKKKKHRSKNKTSASKGGRSRHYSSKLSLFNTNRINTSISKASLFSGRGLESASVKTISLDTLEQDDSEPNSSPPVVSPPAAITSPPRLESSRQRLNLGYYCKNSIGPGGFKSTNV